MSKLTQLRSTTLVAVIILTSLLVAVIPSGAEDAMSNEIRVAIIQGAMGDAIAPVIEAYEAANPGVTVTTEISPEAGNFQPLIAAGNQPDLIFASMSPMMGTLAAEEAVVALEDMPGAQELFAGIEPSMVQQLYGHQYYVPVTAVTTLMIYNRDLFAEAGLDPDAPPVTWDEFLAAAAAIDALPDREGGDEVYGTVFWNEALAWGGWYWNMLQPIYLNANQNECQFLNRLATDIVFDKEECALADFYTFVRDAQQYAPLTMEQNFFAGNIGMWPQFGYGWMSNMREADPPMTVGENVGLAPIPVPNEGDTSYTTLGGRTLMILKTTPEREARAWDFIKFLMQPEHNLDFVKALDNLPTLVELKDDPYFQEPTQLTFVELLENGVVPELTTVAETVGAEVQAVYQEVVIDGTLTPEEGVVAAADRARAALAGE